MSTLSQQEFDGTIFDRKTEFYYFASMNFTEHKRILHSTADVLKSHDLKLHSATDVRLERDVSRKLTFSIAPSGRLKYPKKISITRDLWKDSPSMFS
jgi:hypothetical protein